MGRIECRWVGLNADGDWAWLGAGQPTWAHVTTHPLLICHCCLMQPWVTVYNHLTVSVRGNGWRREGRRIRARREATCKSPSPHLLYPWQWSHWVCTTTILPQVAAQLHQLTCMLHSWGNKSEYNVIRTIVLIKHLQFLIMVPAVYCGNITPWCKSQTVIWTCTCITHTCDRQFQRWQVWCGKKSPTVWPVLHPNGDYKHLCSSDYRWSFLPNHEHSGLLDYR